MSKPAWLPILEQSIKDNPKSSSYALSTLTPDGKPKVRYVIHRGITSTPFLLTTTDTRMAKPEHLAAHRDLEVAWWFEAPNTQFRITGKGITIPSASVESKESIEAKLKAVGARSEEELGDWWEGERKRLWEGVSGHLRAGFARPPPGKKIDEVDTKPEDWPETIPTQSDDPKVQKDIEAGYEHFAIIAIKPEAVEFLELKAMPNRRTQWTLDGDEWKEAKVCP